MRYSRWHTHLIRMKKKTFRSAERKTSSDRVFESSKRQNPRFLASFSFIYFCFHHCQIFIGFFISLLPAFRSRECHNQLTGHSLKFSHSKCGEKADPSSIARYNLRACANTASSCALSSSSTASLFQRLGSCTWCRRLVSMNFTTSSAMAIRGTSTPQPRS